MSGNGGAVRSDAESVSSSIRGGERGGGYQGERDGGYQAGHRSEHPIQSLYPSLEERKELVHHHKIWVLTFNIDNKGYEVFSRCLLGVVLARSWCVSLRGQHRR